MQNFISILMTALASRKESSPGSLIDIDTFGVFALCDPVTIDL